MRLKEIVEKYEHPIIGVIGATSPLPNYDSDDAYRLGYELRNFVENKGTLFTGGVSGVGIDIYNGIIGYCLEKGVSDKFFVLFPNMKLEPTEEYFRLAEKTKDKILKVERVGEDMEERRTCIAAVADILIVMNGATGTIDEALKGLILRKPLLCLQNSGGAAEVLSKFKRGEIQGIPLHVNKELIQPFDSISGLVNYLSSKDLISLTGENK